MMSPASLGGRALLPALTTDQVAPSLTEETISLVDTRHHSAVHQGTVKDAVNIPAGTKVASYGAWTLDPETDHRAVLLGSDQLSAGRLLWNTQKLPASGTIVSYCQLGVRNLVGASTLRRAGFDFVELEGSYAAWNEWPER